MKKYKAAFERIEEFEIIKETPKQIVYITHYGKEARDNKKTTYISWHDTFDEAKQELINKCINKIIKIKAQLDYAEQRLETVRNL